MASTRVGTTKDLGSYLSKRHALIAFEVQAQKRTKAAAQMTDEAFVQEVGKIQNRVGFELAESARKTMSKWLSPSDPRHIGLTGKASQNLFTKSVNAPKSYGKGMQVVWYVYEGDLTKANRFIRRGTRPHKDKSIRARLNSYEAHSKAAKAQMKSGVRSNGMTYIEGPLIARLSEWAKARGLHPKMRPPRLLSKRKLTPERGIGPGPLTKVDIATERWKAWRGMVWALYHSILQKGTSQAYQKRFGTPYYDYAKIYATGSKGTGGTARSVARSKLGRQGEAYQNLSEITARFVYSKFYKSGKVLGKWTSNILGT